MVEFDTDAARSHGLNFHGVDERHCVARDVTVTSPRPRMADTITHEQRRRNMGGVRSRDTRPEMTVRNLLHRAGFRYRLHRRDLPGRPDIVLPRHRVAIFVHGCFWHGHGCSLFRMPATRPEFWSAKIDANRRRDAAAAAALADTAGAASGFGNARCAGAADERLGS